MAITNCCCVVCVNLGEFCGHALDWRKSLVGRTAQFNQPKSDATDAEVLD